MMNFNQFQGQNAGFQGGFQNGFQGGFNGGFNGGFQGNMNNPQNNQDPANVNKSAFINHAKVQLIGYLTTDPKSEMIGQSKVASSSIAINHKGSKQGDDPDYWNIEIWVNQGQSSSLHDFLVDYCKKGRLVFVEGTPYLKKTEAKDPQTKQPILNSQGKPVYTYYPTIRVSTLIALNGGGSSQSDHSAQQQAQQNQANAMTPPMNPPAFGGQPQGFGQPLAGGMGGFPNAPGSNFSPQQPGAPMPPNGFGVPVGAGR
jgi:single-strand DNA-binding protein